MLEKNKKFAEKVELILRDEAQEKAETKSQEDICEEESLYNFSLHQRIIKFYQAFTKQIGIKNFRIYRNSKIKGFIILEKNYFIKKNPIFYPKKIMTKFMGQL